MTPETLIIIGAGGHGREIEHVVRAVNSVTPTWQVEGFVDDNPSADTLTRVNALGHPLLGGLDVLQNRPPAHYVIGIGDGGIRQRLDTQLTSAGWQPATLVHPFSWLGHDVHLGPGTIVCAGVTATTNISTGRHVHLSRNATIGHDCRLADFSTVHPNATLSGTVTLGIRATVGAGATILPNLALPDGALLGAGSVLTRSALPGHVLRGVPAR